MQNEVNYQFLCHYSLKIYIIFIIEFLILICALTIDIK